MIGIKLYNQYRINDPAVHPILELATERRVPILQHAGYPVAEHRASQPLISHGIHFTEASEKYPDAMLIHATLAAAATGNTRVREMRDASPMSISTYRAAT